MVLTSNPKSWRGWWTTLGPVSHFRTHLSQKFHQNSYHSWTTATPWPFSSLPVGTLKTPTWNIWPKFLDSESWNRP